MNRLEILTKEFLKTKKKDNESIQQVLNRLKTYEEKTYFLELIKNKKIGE